MPRFLTGDELGNIKIYTKYPTDQPLACHDAHIEANKAKAVQGLALFPHTGSPDTTISVACAHADGSITLHSSDQRERLTLEKKHEWLETRCKPDQKFVGLAASDRGIYSCTSNGALRLTNIVDGLLSHETSTLPMRLCNWRLSSNSQTFAYGGDEVELSIWDTEKAFATDDNSTSQKRKRSAELLPAEIWRAKNVPNDSLSLRQPVHITSLTYLSTPSLPPNNHLLAGTKYGHVRRYDTRAARRPVADWKDIAKVGGVTLVEKGFAEHEAFVSDNGSNLFSLDTRNGRILFGYQGISGSITSLAPTTAGLASTSLDRFFRLHSVGSPDTQIDKKGEVLEKIYSKSIPTAVVWDPTLENHLPDSGKEDEENSNGVWERMQHVDDSNDEDDSRRNRDKKPRRIK